MPSNTACTMPLKPQDKPFQFFDLPRELRDMVYEYALVEKQLIDPATLWDHALPIVMRHGPQASAFRVPKAFKHEWKGVAEEHASAWTPIITGSSSYHVEVKGFLARVHKIVVRICYQILSNDPRTTQEEFEYDILYVSKLMAKFYPYTSLILQTGLTFDDHGFPGLKHATQAEEIRELNFGCFFSLRSLERLEVHCWKLSEDLLVDQDVDDRYMAKTWTRKKALQLISQHRAIRVDRSRDDMMDISDV